MSVKTGGCDCGQLRYSVEGDPMNTVFCYCRQCQIHTGSDKWFGAWFTPEKFKITAGTAATFSRKGDSGKAINHLFCADCGVNIGAEICVGNFYTIGVATLDEESHFTPAMAIYTASAPGWALFPEGVPKYDTLPPHLGG